MPIAFRPGRLSATCLGLALGIAGPLQAGDIFCADKLHHKDGQNRDIGSNRGVTAPNTIFMPRDVASTPQMMGLVGMMPAPASRDVISTGLERALEAEHHTIMAEVARAAFKAEVDGKQRLLKKLGALDSSNPDPVPSEFKSQLDRLETTMTKMANRLTDVERLLLVHDNFLQDTTKPADIDSSLKAISSRLAEMDKMLVVHDNYLQQLSKNFGTPLAVPGPSIPPVPARPDPAPPAKVDPKAKTP